MNKFGYIVFILCTIIITELFVYSYIIQQDPTKKVLSTRNEASYSDRYISELNTLLTFYSSIEESAFAEGKISTIFVGFARNIKEKDNKLTLQLCPAVNSDSNCSLFNINIDNNLKLTNFKKAADNDKLKIDMEYKFLDKHFNITISKLN